MKKISTQESKDTKSGLSLEILSDAKTKSSCKISKSKIKVYPFYEEKSFKNRNKVVPALYINGDEKYIAMIVKDKVVSISELHQASQKFQTFAASF